jgi:hypothetical protein
VAATRSVPRFLPTLTEVVHPAHPTVVVDELPPPVIDPQAIVERVRADVDLVLQTHLEATVSNAMLDQVAVIVARIREEIEPMVRQAVADAVAAELDTANQP